MVYNSAVAFLGSRNRRVAIALALAGALTPSPLPLSGLHKFYLGQPVWGVIYLLFGWTGIPRLACALEGSWYLMQGEAAFSNRFGLSGEVAASPAAASTATGPDLQRVEAIAETLRQLDNLRQDGLITEFEFEQKRRSLLDQMA